MRRTFIFVGCAAMLAATALASPAAAGAPGEDMVIYQGQMLPDGTVSYTQTKVRAGVSKAAADGGKPMPLTTERAAPSKVHPDLAAAVARPGARGARQQVVITFKDDLKIPAMPEPDTRQPRGADVNVRVQAQADALVAGVKAQREAGYRALRSELRTHDVRALETFWLIKGMVADVPLAAVPALAQREDVQSIELSQTDSPPPADANPNNDEEDARALIRSDPYHDALVSAGLTSGWIGLLDTGVRATHTMFAAPSLLALREDLTGGANPDDDCWNHGTSTAAIISGNGNLGFAFRGITPIRLDSFKVYPAGCGGLNTTAAINGFQRAVQVLDRVIVAEMQPTGSETSALSVAADAAFDAGAVVIAANGNFGPGAGSVRAPATAQKALGIGATDLQTQVIPDYSGRGPTGDGRIKPDLLAPTNVETASSASATATQVFGGTSAATPHAAGAAAVVRNFLRGTTFEFSPGQVYAYLLACGSIAYPFNNTSGAGLVRLAVNGSFWRSTATVGNAQTVDIPIAMAATNNRFSVALWWPEAPATHNDIDLSLINPSGVVVGSSISVPSVFERVSVNGPIAAGTWTIRIRGFSVPGGSQLVNWAAVTTSP